MSTTGFSQDIVLTVTNGAYTIADVVGGLITIPGASRIPGGKTLIHTVVLKGVSAIGYELWFLTGDIATPAADNAAFTIVAADEALIRGVVDIYTSDYRAAQSAFNVATVKQIGLILRTGAEKSSLYAYLKATETTTPGTATLYLTVAGDYLD
jgi:hypothetical protein